MICRAATGRARRAACRLWRAVSIPPLATRIKTSRPWSATWWRRCRRCRRCRRRPRPSHRRPSRPRTLRTRRWPPSRSGSANSRPSRPARPRRYGARQHRLRQRRLHRVRHRRRRARRLRSRQRRPRRVRQPNPPATVRPARTSAAPPPPAPPSPSPRAAEATPAVADLDERTDLPRPADPPAAELATRPRTEISQLRANYGIARQDDSVSDSRAAAAEPTSVSSYAPREDPAPDRLPAVRGSAGDLVGGQGYPPSRDYRPMEYPTTEYRTTDYRAVDYRRVPADYRGLPQDRPARGSVAEFRLRLERLPAGHPSSPWDDQGMPRPTPQQLRQLELPLADEERDADPPAGPACSPRRPISAGRSSSPATARKTCAAASCRRPRAPAIEPPPIGLAPSRPRPSERLSSERLPGQPLPGQPLPGQPAQRPATARPSRAPGPHHRG